MPYADIINRNNWSLGYQDLLYSKGHCTRCLNSHKHINFRTRKLARLCANCQNKHTNEARKRRNKKMNVLSIEEFRELENGMKFGVNTFPDATRFYVYELKHQIDGKYWHRFNGPFTTREEAIKWIEDIKEVPK